MESQQIDIFSIIYQDFKIKNKIRLIELFAGIGSQAKALERLNVDFEHYKVIEFDKYAINSYNAIHGTNFKPIDITKINSEYLEINDTKHFTYLLTYSFPCQDLSIAGKQKGMKKGSNTRSGLLWEVERLLDECDELPQVLLMENVPQVIGEKNIKDFQEWQLKLSSLGYSNYVKILNAKDYGIPQNRKRCFMISILGNYNYQFPKAFNLELKLKDILEENVEEKYFLSQKLIDTFKNYKTEKFDRNKTFKVFDKNKDFVARTITTKAGSRSTDNFLYDKNILCDKLIESGEYNEYDVINHGYTKSRMNGINRLESKNGLSPTLTTRGDTLGVFVKDDKKEISDLRIRKLTPLECWRLMGFDDVDFYKCQKINSNEQLYKQAGNSIVVDVLYYIFKQFF